MAVVHRFMLMAAIDLERCFNNNFDVSNNLRPESNSVELYKQWDASFVPLRDKKITFKNNKKFYVCKFV